MRRALVIVLVLAACGPVEPPAPGELEAPRLEADVTATPFPTVRVHGSPGDGVVLRLYVAEACAGPVLRELSADELTAGVELELVPRAVNVFAVRGHSLDGRRSACSEPLRIESTPLPPPPKPTLQILRLGPSGRPSGRFLLKGTVERPDVEVRLFDEACGGRPWLSLTPAQFEHGVVTTVEPNRTRYFYAQSVDVTGARSECASTSVFTDTVPPSYAELRVLSPNPVRAPQAWVYVSGGFDFSGATIFNAPHCRGSYQSTCIGSFDCYFVFPLFDTVTEWSALVSDGFGNSACFDAPEALVAGPPADDGEPPVLELTGSEFFHQLRVRVRYPSQFALVYLYSQADCQGPYLVQTSYDAVRGRSVESGSVWSARVAVGSPRTLQGESKCSNTIVVP